MNWWRIRQDNYNADRRAKRIAREEGIEEGIAKGKAELSAIVAERLRKRGMSEDEIKGILEQEQE